MSDHKQSTPVWRTLTTWLVVGFVGAWALSIIWWALIEPAAANAETLELIIPEGTAAAIEAGGQPPFIPNALSLGRNKSMIIRNNDVVEHSVGSWVVPPGGVAEVKAAGEDEQVTCTIHPSGVLGVTIDEQPPFASTIFPSLLLGLPLGLVFGVAAAVGSRLDPHGDSTTPPAGQAQSS